MVVLSSGAFIIAPVVMAQANSCLGHLANQAKSKLLENNMKTLIGQNFKALRTGKYVKADEAAGEFVFDDKASDENQASVATLLEIAAANKIKAKKGKKKEVVAILVAGIKKMELPVMSERPVSEVVEEIVKNGIAADQSDDEMLIAIVQAGVKFKQAGKLFNNAMTEGGYRVSAKDRKENIRGHLVEAEFEPSAYSDISEMVTELTKELSDVDLAQALRGIKAYAKEFELELPKPPKKAKGGFKVVVQDAVIANPAITLEEFRTLCEENKRDVERCEKTMWPNVLFAQAVVESANKIAES